MAIRFVSLEELFGSLKKRQESHEVQKIKLRGDAHEVSGYFEYLGECFQDYNGCYGTELVLKEIQTVLERVHPDRVIDGARIMFVVIGNNLYLHDKGATVALKEGGWRSYRVLEIQNNKKCMVLKLQFINRTHKDAGKVFYTRLPKDCELFEDTLGLLAKAL